MKKEVKYSKKVVSNTKKESIKKNSKEKELFSTEDIENLKSITEDKNLIEDSDELIKEINKSISGSEIELAKKVIQCYDILDTNSFQFKNEEKDYSKKIEEYLSKFNISEIRSLITEYGDGTGYGSYLLGENIKRNVNSNRKTYMELIKFFLRIFSEED